MIITDSQFDKNDCITKLNNSQSNSSKMLSVNLSITNQPNKPTYTQTH